MFERSLVSHVLFPVPRTSYTEASFPGELIWVPKVGQDGASPESTTAKERIPCLLLTYPSARFLMIVFHSNAEDLGRCRGFCDYLREQFQVHVLAVEYPGYGICPGNPTSESVMENAFAALYFARTTLQWPLDSIKIFGRSIGTGPAISLAAHVNCAGVVLVTPFLSIRKLFQDRVGPLAGLVDDIFNNEEAAPLIRSPTMIIHGHRDRMISHHHGESLYTLIRSRKMFVSPPDMEHNTNLLANLQYFVLPMFQFFALPDYVFQDIVVPAWAYVPQASAEASSMTVQISSRLSPVLARGDTSLPSTTNDPGFEDAIRGAPRLLRLARAMNASPVWQLANASDPAPTSATRSSDLPDDDSYPCVDMTDALSKEMNTMASKGATAGGKPKRAPHGHGAPAALGVLGQVASRVPNRLHLHSSEAEAAIRRLEAFAATLHLDTTESDGELPPDGDVSDDTASAMHSLITGTRRSFALGEDSIPPRSTRRPQAGVIGSLPTIPLNRNSAQASACLLCCRGPAGQALRDEAQNVARSAPLDEELLTQVGNQVVPLRLGKSSANILSI